MDKLKILQWNCRGLNNKISDLILFSTEKEIDIICLNEVKNWRKSKLPQQQHRCNGHHGSAILVKKSIVIKQIEPVEKEIDSNERILETLNFCLKLPFF